MSPGYLSGYRKTINKVLGDKYLEMRFFTEDKGSCSGPLSINCNEEPMPLVVLRWESPEVHNESWPGLQKSQRNQQGISAEGSASRVAQKV